MLNYCIVIPARYNSTRLNGKPLATIKGKKLIERVWLQCVKAVDKKYIYILTDDLRIKNFCESNSMNVVMTSKKHLTGTDRVCEFSKKYIFDYYINVQGDEPLIDPKDIKYFLNKIKIYPDTILNGKTKIRDKKEFFNLNIPKVVTNEKYDLMYMSRSPIPISKNGIHKKSYKQVCIYSYPRKKLKFFGSHKIKSKNEIIEDIEILRFLDNNYKIKMIEFKNSSIAVDTYSDLIKVRKIVKD